MDGWTKNSLKCTTSHSGKDTGKMELFGKGTVNRKGMGGKYQSIRWKDTFRFSILWDLKILLHIVLFLPQLKLNVNNY